jgi:hypothetical protein
MMLENVFANLHPVTDHEGPEGEKRYRCILSLALVLDECMLSLLRPGRFTPEERDPVRIVLDWCEKSRPRRDSFPGLSISAHHATGNKIIFLLELLKIRA